MPSGGIWGSPPWALTGCSAVSEHKGRWDCSSPVMKPAVPGQQGAKHVSETQVRKKSELNWSINIGLQGPERGILLQRGAAQGGSFRCIRSCCGWMQDLIWCKGGEGHCMLKTEHAQRQREAKVKAHSTWENPKTSKCASLLLSSHPFSFFLPTSFPAPFLSSLLIFLQTFFHSSCNSYVPGTGNVCWTMTTEPSLLELRVHPAGAGLSLAAYTWELHRGSGNDSQLEVQLESYFSRSREDRLQAFNQENCLGTCKDRGCAINYYQSSVELLHSVV